MNRQKGLCVEAALISDGVEYVSGASTFLVKSAQSSFQFDLNSNWGLATNFKVWSPHKATWRKSEEGFPLLCKQSDSQTAHKSRSLYFWKSSAANWLAVCRSPELRSESDDALTQRWLPTVVWRLESYLKWSRITEDFGRNQSILIVFEYSRAYTC